MNSDSPNALPEMACDTPNALTVKQRLINFITHRQTWGFLVSVAIMAVIALAFFYPANVDGLDLRQHDMVQGMANGQEVTAFHEKTGETSRWTNSLFGGMPTFQISPTYPSDSLFRWVTKVYGLGLPSPSNLLFMMMLGMMILLISLKIRWEYSLIGAIAWGFSTYFVIIIGAGHIWKFVTLAYIPPTIAGILLAYNGRRLAGGAMAAFFAMMQLSANHVQMSYYFGFVILAVMIAYLVSAIREKSVKGWLSATGVLAIAAILALAANSPNLYHTWRYAKETQRGAPELVTDNTGATNGLSKDYITQYSYGRSELFTLVIPNVKGGATAKPVNGGLQRLSLADLDKAQDYNRDKMVAFYLQYSDQYFGEPEGTNGPVYVGVIIFALFLFGCFAVKGPLKWALVVMTILSAILALGRNFMVVTDFFIDYIPLYSKFRTPESILVVAEFTIPVLAIIALAQLLEAGRKAARKLLKPLSISFGIVGVICLLGIVSPTIFGDPVDMTRERSTTQMLGEALLNQGYPEDVVRQISIDNPAVYNAVEDLHCDMVKADSTRSLIFAALGYLALLAFAMGYIMPLVAGAAVGVLVLADLYNVDKRYIDNDSFAKMSSRQASRIEPTDIDRHILGDTDPNYRVLDIDRFTQPEPSYFHKMLGGYHAAKLGRYQDVMDRGLLFQENVFNMLNARYLVYGGQISYNDFALGNAWFVDDIEYVKTPNEEIEALATLETSNAAVADERFADILGTVESQLPSDNIEETEYAPNSLTYTSSAAGDRIAVFSEIYFPWGWEATIDGKPAEIARVNYILRAMRIPAGTHTITMTFNPRSVTTTCTIATIAVILIYIWVLIASYSSICGCPFARLRRNKVC